MDLVAAIITLLVLLVVLLQLGMWWRSKRQVGRPAPDTLALTGRALGENERALFYFYSQNCGACKPVSRLVNEFKTRYDRIYAIDIASHAQLARDFGLLATPTVYIVENGHIVQVRLGAQSRKQLERLL
jgi:thioredoxin 1